MAYKYRPSDDKTVKERATQQGGSFDSYTNPSFPTFRPAKGKHAIRILPPSSQIDIDKWGDTWSILIWIHYSIGTDKSSYLCLEKMKEETCPLCEARAEQNADREDDDKEDPLKPGKRALAWVIDRDNEKDGPLLWAMPWTVERDIQALRIDKKLGVIAIDDPDNGYDVEFVVEGEKLTTKYVGMRIARDSTPLSDNQKRQDKWLDFIEENALPDVLKFYEDTYLDKVYRGKISRKGDDDDETSSRKSSKKSPRDDDDDTDNRSRRSAKPSQNEDEGTEEDARSSKRTRKDEDDVDEDDRRTSRPSNKQDRDEDDKDERKSTRPSTKRSTSRDDDDDKDTKKSRNDEAKERIKNLNKRSRDDDDNEEENEDEEDNKRSSKRSSRDDDDDDNRSSRRRPSSRDDD